MNTEFVKAVKEELLTIGADDSCINVLLGYGIKEEPQEFLKAECHNKVIYIAYTAVDNNTYITAHDIRSWGDIWQTKTAKVFPSILECMPLKGAFFNTLKMGSIEDRLFEIVNNPDDQTVNKGYQTNIGKILNLCEKIYLPSNIRHDAVTEMESYRGITTIKSISTYDPSFGEIYFMKGDIIKSIQLIGDRHISLEYLVYEETLISELFKDTEEPIHIQQLEYVLDDLEGPIKVCRDGEAIKLRYTSFFDHDSFYTIGDDYIMQYNQTKGISCKHIHIPKRKRYNKCKKAYSLLDAIEREDVQDRYKGFSLDNKGTFERSYTNDETDED